MKARTLITELRAQADPEIAAHSQRFFRTEPGGYGEGDRFLGLRVPAVARSPAAPAGFPHRDPQAPQLAVA